MNAAVADALCWMRKPRPPRRPPPRNRPPLPLRPLPPPLKFGRFTRFGMTLSWHPLKSELSSKTAFSIDSFSLNWRRCEKRGAREFMNVWRCTRWLCERTSMYAWPFGLPVNLSHRIVTRLIVPHDAKWACNSSGVAS